jgi:hypothetical protein
MSLRVTHWLGLVLLLAGSVTMLYHTSYRVHAQEQELRRLRVATLQEQEKLHVLGADWAMLTAPARLQKLSDRFLTLRAVKAKQIVGPQKLERVLALRTDPALQAAAADVRQRLAYSNPVASVSR